jgi:hypothetical protein
MDFLHGCNFHGNRSSESRRPECFSDHFSGAAEGGPMVQEKTLKKELPASQGVRI